MHQTWQRRAQALAQEVRDMLLTGLCICWALNKPATSQCPEPLCNRHPGRLHRFMVLHRISERGFTMFFAIKEALLNVTKTMNPHPEQQLNTE